jgi:DNA gyrase subunit A
MSTGHQGAAAKETDQIMLVTDGGQLIRTPIHDIRIAGRNTQGVTIFRTRDEEKVVSVGRVEEVDEEDDDHGGDQTGGADANLND